jgi:hypothetical protein
MLLLLPPAVLAASRLLAGCSSSTSTTIQVPVTGLVVSSASLTAGHGCGKGPGQVYKYLVVAAYPLEPTVPAGPTTGPGQASVLTSCYTDAILSALPADPHADSGATQYDFVLYVYAYDYDTFQKLPPDLDCAPGTAGRSCAGDSLANVTVDGGIEPLYAPTWTTTCHATEQSGIPVVATCAPLQASMLAPTEVTVPTQAFTVANDGGILTCHAGYETVVAFWTAGDGGGDAGAGTSWVQCPAPVVIPDASPDTPYAIDLNLVGSRSAQTRCTATPARGTNALASCLPVQPAP